MRLFTAIDLPEAVQERLSMISCGLPGARWVVPEQLHLTLRFIGEKDGSELRGVMDTLAEVRCAPFQLQLQGVGFFPPRKKPRLVWVGVDENGALNSLYRSIESSLVRAGMEPEGRKYAPHITLARLRNTPAAKVGNWLGQHSQLFFMPFQVDGFQLYSSVLNERGARHYIEAEYSLW